MTRTPILSSRFCFRTARGLAWAARSLYRRDYLDAKGLRTAFNYSQRLYRLGIKVSRSEREAAEIQTAESGPKTAARNGRSRLVDLDVRLPRAPR